MFCVVAFTTIQAQEKVLVNVVQGAEQESAIFQVDSTTQGVLIPRMSETERDAILNPAEGLMVYNTTEKCINYYRKETESTDYWFSSCNDTP